MDLLGKRRAASQATSTEECILFLYHALGDPAGGAGKTSTSASPFEKSGYPVGGRYKLIVASNRDEDLNRPTAPIHFWKDAKSNMLAGRDLVAGGTWLGVSRSGKFATVTNIPSFWDDVLALAAGKATAAALASAAAAAAATAAGLARRRQGEFVVSLGLFCVGIVTASVGLAVAAGAATRRSRGELVADFLKGDEDAQQYCSRLSKDLGRYAGFNLVLADPGSAWVLSNRDEDGVKRLPHGFYGVSNATLDTPWAKMVYGKSRVLQVLLRMAVDPQFSEDALVDVLMDVLADESPCRPAEGLSPRAFGAALHAKARVCVPPMALPTLLGVGSTQQKYGTRSSTVVLVDASGRMKVVERNLGDGSEAVMHSAERNAFEFCDV